MRYIVIDFEATCDEPYNPDPQEIIEWPALFVDPERSTAQPEFHTFVRPVAHPRLTDFCRGLTGIHQEQVDGACLFPEALEQFEAWLRTQGSGEMLAVTCGDWDLGSLLPRQCAGAHLPIPEWANRWGNLERIFARHFRPGAERVGLREMAESLDLPLVGRLHSGIDDARNIAQVLRRVLDLGVRVGNTASWRCPGCGIENLYRARQCVQCGRSSITLRGGDWACPRCGFGNFAHREKCFDCGGPRPAGLAGSQPLHLKPGDWLCRKCGEHNATRRRSCSRCGSARHQESG